MRAWLFAKLEVQEVDC